MLPISRRRVENSKYILSKFLTFFFFFLHRACVILGIIFLLSSICIVIKAIHDLAKKVLPEVVRWFMFFKMFSLHCQWNWERPTSPFIKPWTSPLSSPWTWWSCSRCRSCLAARTGPALQAVFFSYVMESGLYRFLQAWLHLLLFIFTFTGQIFRSVITFIQVFMQE